MSAASDFTDMIAAFFADDPLTAYYTKAVQGSYDTATSQYSSTVVEIPCQAIMLDLTRNSNGLSSKYGTEILMGDKDLYIRPPEQSDPLATPLTIDPTNDRVRVGSVVYKVEVVKTLDPTNSAPLLYNMLVRR